MYEKNHQNYANRADLEMMNKFVGWDRTTVMMPANDLWKEHRRNFSRLFGSRSTMQKFHGTQVHATRRLMFRIMQRPQELASHIR